MNIREPEKQFFDDFEHKVTGKIKTYGDRSDFPQLADYGIDRQDLDGYLFDKQAILDMGGSPRNQLTVGGILIVLPVLVLSAFPDNSEVYAPGKMWATVAALAIGLMVALLLKAVLKIVIFWQLGKLRNAKMESYIKAVLFYQPLGQQEIGVSEQKFYNRHYDK